MCAKVKDITKKRHPGLLGGEHLVEQEGIILGF